MPPRPGSSAPAIAVGIAGKIGMGLVGDRMPARRAASPPSCSWPRARSLLLAVGRVPALLPVFLVVHGFTVAAENVMLPLVVVECFGVRHLARIYGALMFALLPGGLAGPTFAGWMFDRLGTYWPAFAVFAAGNVLAVAGWRPCVASGPDARSGVRRARAAAGRSGRRARRRAAPAVARPVGAPRWGAGARDRRRSAGSRASGCGRGSCRGRRS